MISLILIIIASLFFTGIVIRVRSIFSGRKGPDISQPLKDIWRLLKKGVVYSETSSIIFRIAPSVYFSTVLTAILLLPFGDRPGLISFAGDFVFFAYVLALGKFFMIIAAMDTGSSFEGMGASREALFSLLTEPAFFTLMGSFALFTGYTSFHEIFQNVHFDSYTSFTLGALATFVFIIITMIENSRMPVDDPRTHLELTMVHEVMVLDNSGFDLGLILHATNLKFAMYGALIANIFIPAGIPLFYSIPIFMMIMVLFAAIVATIESFMARFRMNHNAQFIFSLTSISIVIFLVVLLMLGRMA
ncbi:MAG TPA: NADH-quinone oxidoreductase subunit H [Chryseosolibacter sp.]